MTSVEVGGIGSSGQVLPQLLGNKYVAATLNSASGTTPVTLVAGDPGYYVTRLLVQVDPTCTLASGGMLTVSFTDTGSGQVIGAYRTYIPAAFVAPTGVVGDALAPTGDGYLYFATTSDSTLQVSLSVALTGGSIRCSANTGITDVIGTP